MCACARTRVHAFFLTPLNLSSLFFHTLHFFPLLPCISSIFDLFDVIFAKAARFPSFMRSIFNRILVSPFFSFAWVIFFVQLFFFFISCIRVGGMLPEVPTHVSMYTSGTFEFFIFGPRFGASKELRAIG